MSWLRWKEKAQKIFAHIRHVCNPLSLNIRLLTVENLCNKLFFTVDLLHFMVCKLHCLSWFDPTRVAMNLLISFLLCPVSSRSGVTVYSDEGIQRVLINSADNSKLYKGRAGIQNDLYKLEESERSGCRNKRGSWY